MYASTLLIASSFLSLASRFAFLRARLASRAARASRFFSRSFRSSRTSLSFLQHFGSLCLRSAIRSACVPPLIGACIHTWIIIGRCAAMDPLFRSAQSDLFVA